MPQLLYSSIPPINRRKDSVNIYSILDAEITQADSVKIATGYISTGSLLQLARIVEINKKPKVELIIGMHYFDGFTRPQYKAALKLHKILTNYNLGEVFLADVFPFHGKLYSFGKNNDIYAASIGSSNFSGFGQYHRSFEVDVLFEKGNIITDVDILISNLVEQTSSSIDTFPEKDMFFKDDLPPLENVDGVTKLSSGEVEKVKSRITDILFELPLKDSPRSNLNTYFGKGRQNKMTGFIQPRHWYEVELIVPKAITNLMSYPKANIDNGVFKVVTDDGWLFECKVSGNNSKNFRSYHDLKILGRWIKGRLENAGVLDAGKPVTSTTLTNYGRTSISMVATTDPKLWYLDMSI